MASGSYNEGYFEDRRSSEYDDLSKRYADYWQGHDPNTKHYLNARTAQTRYYLDRERSGVWPKSGAGVVFGPGFRVAERDFEPTFVETQLADHPALVVVDFSRRVLQDAYHSLHNASPRLEPKIVLARRDLSGGLSSRFDAFLLDKIDAITTEDELEIFMQEIERGVKNQQIIEEIKGQNIAKGTSRHGDPNVIRVTEGSEFDFSQITNEIAPVRFMVCNLLLAGMIALTEGAFREKLMDVITRAQVTKEKIQVNTANVVDLTKSQIETVKHYLRIWHELVTQVNTEIASNFISGALDANPEAELSIVTDETVTYTNLAKYDRWDFKNVRKNLCVNRIAINHAGDWQLDDSLETPAHTHGISHLIARKSEFKFDEETPEATAS